MSPESRVEALKRVEPGTWIAFSADESRVVAQGKTYDEAVKAAEEAGELDPVITRVAARFFQNFSVKIDSAPDPPSIELQGILTH